MSPLMTIFPLSSHIPCVHMDFTVDILWETKRRVVPELNISFILLTHFFLNKTSPTDKTSSTMRTSGCIIVATEKPSLDFIPDEPFIFFAEDINEPVYKIDKMFRQLLNIEKFRQNISGLCLGDFSNTDNKDWLLKLLIEISEELSIPSSLGFKISHTACKTTIPIGARGMLNGKTLQILK